MDQPVDAHNKANLIVELEGRLIIKEHAEPNVQKVQWPSRLVDYFFYYLYFLYFLFFLL